MSGAAAASRLRRRELLDPAGGEVEQLVEQLPREGVALGGRLHLDEPPVAGHDDVHVDLGARVLRRSRGRAAARRRRSPTETAATEPGSAFESPKRSSARCAATYAPRDRGAARAAVGLEHVAVEPERALAERLEVAAPRGARGRSAAGSRPCGRLAARATPRAACARRSTPAAASTRPSSSRCPAAQPARHALLDDRRAEHARLALRRRAPSRAAARGSRARCRAARSSSGRAAVVALMRRALERRRRRRARPRRSAAGGSARPSSRNSSGSPVVRKRYAPSRSRVVLDALARERLGDLARGLLRREDERDAAAEDALEDRPDQRVVRAAEDDRVDAGLLERRRVLAHRVDGLLAERVVALDQRHEPRARDRRRRSTPASSARTSAS